MLSEYKDSKGVIWVTDDSLCYGTYGGAGDVGVANVRWLENQETTTSHHVLHCSFLYDRIIDPHHMVFDDELMRFHLNDPNKYDEAEVIIFNLYGGGTAYVRKDSELYEEVQGLENYPCFDDQLVSEVDAEWQEEARETLQWDLYKMMEGEYPNFDDWLETPCASIGNPNPMLPALDPHMAIDLWLESDNFFDDCFWKAVELSNEDWIYEYDSATLDLDKVYPFFKEAVFNKIKEFFSRPGTHFHNLKLTKERQLKLF